MWRSRIGLLRRVVRLRGLARLRPPLRRVVLSRRSLPERSLPRTWNDPKEPSRDMGIDAISAGSRAPGTSGPALTLAVG